MFEVHAVALTSGTKIPDFDPVHTHWKRMSSGRKTVTLRLYQNVQFLCLGTRGLESPEARPEMFRRQNLALLLAEWKDLRS